MGQELSHEEEIGDDVAPEMLSERSIDAVAQYIKDSAKNIVVLTGAGLSTAAGIPDFRSPKTGLYANLERLNLPYAEAVFDISYFRKNPEPFYMLARELYPGKYIPTISHAFIALLEKKDKLCMLFTQNIDCLERAAGISSHLLIEAHGSFATQSCIECDLEYPEFLMKEAIENARVPRCSENPNRGVGDEKCNGLVKPDIVFFGEQLPAEFHSNIHIAGAADIMLVIGTSLTVHPFASLPGLAKPGVPRVLFNMEKVGDLGTRADDVCVLGPCDDGVRKLAAALGWTDELEQLWAAMGGGKDSRPPVTADDEIDQITKAVGEATISDDKEEKQSFQPHVEEMQKKSDEPTAEKVSAEKPAEEKPSPEPEEKSLQQHLEDMQKKSEKPSAEEKDVATTPSQESEGDHVGLKQVGENTQEVADFNPSASASSEPTSKPLSDSSNYNRDVPQATDSKELTQHSSGPTDKEMDLPKSPPKSNI